MSLLFFQPFNFFSNLLNHIFVCNFLIQTENDENLATKLFCKVCKTCFHTFSKRIRTKVCFGCNWFYLNTNSFISNFCNVVDVTSMV